MRFRMKSFIERENTTSATEVGIRVESSLLCQVLINAVIGNLILILR